MTADMFAEQDKRFSTAFGQQVVIKGEPGPKGDKGDKGEPGERGPAGADGRDGTDATVTTESIKDALGYTPADDADMAGKLPKTPADWPDWTADEQAAARERMGLPGEYEFIEEVTLEEEVRMIDRKLEPNGNEYYFRELSIYVFTPPASGSATCDCVVTDSNGIKHYGVISSMLSTTTKNSLFMFERKGGYILPQTMSVSGDTVLKISTVYASPNSLFVGNGKIKSVELQIRSTYNTLLPIGTKIKIYGVRA